MPFKREYSTKSGTKRMTFYTDIRVREGGKPTGERVRRLIPKARTMQEARRAERVIEQQLSTGQQERATPLLTDFLNDTYIPWARENKSVPALDERHVRTVCASAHLQGRRMDEISVIQIENFKKERKGALSEWKRPFSAGSINNELSVLARAFRLAVDSGLVRQNPCRLANRLDDAGRAFRILEREDEPALFAALRDSPAYLLPLSRLALLTGMRQCELLALTEAVIDFRRDLLYVLNPKWRKDKRKTEGLPFSAEARALIIELCGKAEGGLLFTRADRQRISGPMVSTRFRAAARRAGLAGLRFHDLRHSFGTRLGEANRSPYEIARLLGHANIQTSMIYVHPATSNLRQAVEEAAAYRFGHPAVTKKSGTDNGVAANVVTPRRM